MATDIYAYTSILLNEIRCCIKGLSFHFDKIGKNLTICAGNEKNIPEETKNQINKTVCISIRELRSRKMWGSTTGQISWKITRPFEVS